MAKRTTGGEDLRLQGGSGSLAATTAGDWVELDGAFNIFMSGTWTGPVALECSPDGGTTAFACEYSDGSPVVFTSNGQLVAPDATEKGMLYRLNRGAGTGTLVWRLSR
jgi:hypothetical protein